MTTLTETREISFHVVSSICDVNRAITRGRFNFALTEVETGAVIHTFIPETDSVADIMAKLNATSPGSASFPWTACHDAADHISHDETPAAPIRWEVTNNRTGKVTSYKTSRAAMNACDRMDNEYGAVICTRRAIWG